MGRFWGRRLFLGSSLAPLWPLTAADAAAPVLGFDRALLDLSRMAGPYGAGRISILLEGGAVDSGDEELDLTRIDFVQLRANGIPAVGPSSAPG